MYKNPDHLHIIGFHEARIRLFIFSNSSLGESEIGGRQNYSLFKKMYRMLLCKTVSYLFLHRRKHVSVQGNYAWLS